MSQGKGNLAAARIAAAQANAEVLKLFVPQLFTSMDVMDPTGESKAFTDEWKLTNMPADCILPLAGLHMVAFQEGITETIKTKDKDGKEIEVEVPGPGAYLEDFIQNILRGFKGINGFSAKQAENIAISLGGGGKKGMLQRRGWASRNITHRNEPEYEEVDDEE